MLAIAQPEQYSKLRDRHFTYILTLAHSRNIYTSSTNLPAWYHFTQKERFYWQLYVAGSNKTYLVLHIVPF
jgi:hypothetical protein